MQINDGFGLFKVDGVPYVLPYGQSIADHRKGFRLNESGLILWNEIQKGLEKDALVDKLMSHYEAEEYERNLLEADVNDFISKLRQLGVLKETCNFYQSVKRCFTIGGIRVNINSSEELVHDYFNAFESRSDDKPDLSINIMAGVPNIIENGNLLLRNRELCVLRGKNKYIFIFPEAKQILEAHLSADGKQAFLYVRMPYNESLRNDLYHAIRLIYLYRAQLENMFVVHSASILYEGKIWLFSAPSGVGKSTHAKLWQDRFKTPIVNGDLNMLAIENGKPVVHGIPWCGTSEIYDAKTYPLGGVVFLKRAMHNRCEDMTLEEKSLSLMHRMISPAWTEDMINTNLQFAEKIASKVPMYRYGCTKEIEAAETLKKHIDTDFDYKK